jgi:hypothetical protein
MGWDRRVYSGKGKGLIASCSFLLMSPSVFLPAHTAFCVKHGDVFSFPLPSTFTSPYTLFLRSEAEDE